MAKPAWLMGLRDVDIFPPPPRVTLMCRRDMSLERDIAKTLRPGSNTVRAEYVIDQFNGKNWGRVGSGKYLEYTQIPPVGCMKKPKGALRVNEVLIIEVASGRYTGVFIGRVYKSGRRYVWQLQSPFNEEWVDIPPKYVLGWLPLV